jgi:hypothetical protein
MKTIGAFNYEDDPCPDCKKNLVILGEESCTSCRVNSNEN